MTTETQNNKPLYRVSFSRITGKDADGNDHSESRVRSAQPGHARATSKAPSSNATSSPPISSTTTA